jgi:thioesterase domain-containing protein
VLVLGHCAGSMIAYEMAQQLTAAGRQPRGLILIDPPADPKMASRLHKSGLALSLMQEGLKREAAEVERLAREERDSMSGVARRELVGRGIECAAGLYVPKPYSGATLLFHSALRKAHLLDKQRGFPALVANLESADIGSRHEEMFDGGLAQIRPAMAAFIARTTS